MRLPRLLLPGVLLLLCLAGRLLSPPTWRGQPDPPPPRGESLWAPFGDDLRGSCNAFLSLQAHNFLRHGLAATGGVPVLNLTHCSPEELRYYDHHPPGVPLVTAAAFRIFGESEATARGVALLFSCLALAAVLWFVQSSLRPSASLLAAAAVASLPMGLYWAAHLNYELPTLALAAVAFTAAIRDQETTATRFVAALALIAACLMDLVGAFAALALALDRVSLRPRRLAAALGWLAAGGAGIAAWWFWKDWQLGRHGQGLGGSLLEHLQNVSILAPLQGRTEWDIGQWVTVAGGHLWRLCGGWPLLVLAAEMLFLLAPGPADRPRRFLRASLLLALLAWVVPAVRSYDHPYYAVYFQLPLMLAAGLLAARLWRLAEAGPRLLQAAARPLAAGAVAIALLVTGIRQEWLRPTPPPGRPAGYVVGRELARKVRDPSVVLAIEPGGGFDSIVLTWYAGRLVLDLDPEDDASRARFAGALHEYGLDLEDCVVLLALDPDWPGRGGLRQLHPPE